MNYHNDNTIKIQYNQTVSGDVTPQNAVGATTSTSLRTLGFTPSDSNSIFVSKAGDDTSSGTMLHPVKSINQANDLVTSSSGHIVILDSETYEEPYIDFDSNLVGIYAALGETPKITPSQTINADNYTVESIGTEQLNSTTHSYMSCHALSNGEFLYVGIAGLTVMHLQKVDKDGNKVGGAISPPGSDIWGYNCHPIDGGFIVVYLNAATLYAATSLRIYCYNNDMSVKWTQTYEYSTNNVCAIGDFGDDNIIIYYRVTGVGRFIVISKEDGSIVVGQSSIGQYPQLNAKGACVPYDGGSIFICSLDNSSVSAVWIFKVSSAGVLVDSQLLYNAGLDNSSNNNPFSNDCIINSNGELVIAYNNYSGTGGVYYKVLDPSDFSEITGETLIKAIAYSGYPQTSIDQSWDGNYIISFNRGFDGYLYVYTNDFSEILYSVEASTAGIGNSGTYSDVVDRYLTVNRYNSGTTTRGVILKGFVWDWWTTFQSDIEFNGIDFDCENVDGMSTVIDTNLSINTKVKWCTFQNTTRSNYNDTVEYPLTLFKSTATSNTISNVLIHDNDTGMYIESNNVDISYCQVYKNLRGEGFHVKGSGSGISINHCDFLYNSTGIKLEDNNGSEIIKNSIFYKNAYYSIYVDTQICYTNSVDVDNSYNTSSGTLIIQSNPLYVNDGYLTPANINLNLKSKELGYNFDSPGIGIADDLENAGSLLVTYDGSTETWDSITIEKEQIDIEYKPVGDWKQTYVDGSTGGGRDSYELILTLSWNALKNSDFEKIKLVYFCSDPTVRIYLDPVTHSTQYNTYTLLYDKLTASPPLPKLSRSGVGKFEISFSRAYNEGE